jgi:hypothetical protein
MFPFLPEVFVPGTSRAVQTDFEPYKEKWKKWKREVQREMEKVEKRKLWGDTFPATRCINKLSP